MIADRIKTFKRVPVSSLIDNPRNWRKHPDAQRKALGGLLESVGWADAVLARETDEGLMLIDGHLRKELADDSKIPVLVLDVTEAEADLILATHDPLTSMAETDQALLDELVNGLDIADDETQKLLDDLATDPAVEEDEDDVPELPDKPTTVPGDLFELGDHRLLCGDATNVDDVQKLMDGQTAILMSTDPPYGVDFEGAKYNPRAKHWDGIEGDKVQGGNLTVFIEDMLRAWFPYIDEKAAFYLWAAAMTEGAAAAEGIRAAGLHIQSQIIWNKNCLALGQADYHWKHENCWYAFFKGKKHRWFGERDKTTVWDVHKVANAAYVHPMQKPVELYAIPMRHHTKKNELVAEPFAGSGSQFIAAEQMGRRCYGMEIAPAFCDVIIERWENLTGLKAKKVK